MLKNILTVLIIIIFGFIGITFFFSDLGPGESWTFRWIQVAGYYMAFGALIGRIKYPKWFISAFLSWGTVVLVLINLAGALSGGWETISQAGQMIFIPLFCSLLGSFVIFKLTKNK